MKCMSHRFDDYFPVPDTNKNWIRNFFEINSHEINGLVSLEENSLLEMSTKGSLKIQFNKRSLANFWLQVRSDYQDLSNKALKNLMPFPTTYLCE